MCCLLYPWNGLFTVGYYVVPHRRQDIVWYYLHIMLRSSFLFHTVHARKLSVFRLVPTLTSELRCDLSLDSWCKCECRDTGFILVPATGPYVQQSVRVHCIILHRSARRGNYKQGGRGGEASKSQKAMLIETKCQYRAESAGVVA